MVVLRTRSLPLLQRERRHRPASRLCTWAGAAGELLDVLEQLDADRAALIGRLHLRDNAAWLAELLTGLGDEAGEMARLRLVEGLRSTLEAL
jgi:hypothetical protein